jgi:hypothetical protein
MAYSTRKLLGAAVLSIGLVAAASSARAADGEPAAPVSHDVGQLAGWVVGSGDNDGLPFAIVDKPGAEVFVYDAEGRLLGAEPALLGAARGDDSIPGIGERELSTITPEERTTPAGRFLAGFGPARGQARVLWVDFATAVALHPVVTSNPKEQRLKRLQSQSVEDNRITYGCINVSAEFYRDVVSEAFKDTKAVFYILPDAKPVEAVFPGVEAYMSASAAPADGAGTADLAGPTQPASQTLADAGS